MVRRRIRNDKVRKLYDAAIRQGWSSYLDGRGHVRVVSPDGESAFWISTTANNVPMGHTYENVRADARRAGLDVSKL